jgi:lysophospholipase L1-like esterase
LLQQAIVFAGGKNNRVVVLSIPDWGVTPFAEDRDREQIAKEIDLFNAVNHEVSVQHKVHYLDITAISRQAAFDLTLIAEDKLHPSALMYALWAEKLTPIMLKELKQ